MSAKHTPNAKSSDSKHHLLSINVSLLYPSFHCPLYNTAAARPARPITTLPAPTINSFFAPLFAVVLAEAEAEVPLPVLLATLTAPLDSVVAAPEAVPASVVAAETADDTAREMAELVVVGYCEASEQ